MSITSPLASLYQVLQTARTSAQTHSELLRKNEAATRAALIDPVLRALGWDTANVQMVEPEKTINTAWRADYALHNSDSKIDLLLEAKCLGSNLEKFSVVQQLLSYAFGFGVLKVVVTDGIDWHFYTEFKPGNSIANAQFNLLNDDIVACALQLIQWLDSAQSGHGIQMATSEPTVSLSSQTLDFAQKAKPVALKHRQPTKQKATENSFTDVGQLHLMNLLPGQKPKQLRLPNGTVKSISSWKDILLEVCRLLLKTNTQLPIPFPDKAGKKSSLFSLTKPAKGSSTLTTYNNQSLFIYTNYSAEACVANAMHAAKQLPTNQQITSLAVSF